MREIRPSGSEGGQGSIPLSLPFLQETEMRLRSPFVHGLAQGLLPVPLGVDMCSRTSGTGKAECRNQPHPGGGAGINCLAARSQAQGFQKLP